LGKGLQCCALSHYGLDQTPVEQAAAAEEVEELGVAMANFIKKLSRLLIRDYSFYRIYGRSCTGSSALLPKGLRFEAVEKKQINSSPYAAIGEHAWYHDR
jgi:hypothetical protein